MLRNNAVSGNPDFAGMKATHLLNFYVPLVVARAEGVDHERVKAQIFAELANQDGYATLTPGQREEYHKRKALELLREHPVSAALVVLSNVPILFLDYPPQAATVLLSERRREWMQQYMSEYATTKGSRFDVSGYPRVASDLVANGLFVPLAHFVIFKVYLVGVVIGGITGLVHFLRQPGQRGVALFALSSILYLIFMSSMWSQGRLRMPILPLWAVFCAYGGMVSWKALRERQVCRRGSPRSDPSAA